MSDAPEMSPHFHAAMRRGTLTLIAKLRSGRPSRVELHQVADQFVLLLAQLDAQDSELQILRGQFEAAVDNRVSDELAASIRGEENNDG